MTRPPLPDGPPLRVVRAGDRATLSPAVSARTPAAAPERQRASWTAAEIMAMTFRPPKWAVPGILPEGVTVLAGAPKVGKSWLSLGLGLTIAAGGIALGRIDVQPGPVLYLALEDTPRRLQNRMRKLLDGKPGPAGLTLAVHCPPLPSGGVEHIAGWLDRNPDARMVVLDVFAKMRGAPPAGLSAYDADYAAVGRAKALADRYGVAVVLVHHVRKAAAEDFLAEVSGTNGLAGAADTTLVLKRGRGAADGILQVTGRDIEEAEHPLAFNPATGAWRLLDGTATEHDLHDTRAAILRWVRAHPGATPKATAEGTGLNADNVRKTCVRMADDGQLHAAPGGRYTALVGGLPDGSAYHPAGVPAVPAVSAPHPTWTDTEGQAAGPAVPDWTDQ